jgi:uncharacterized membrane protein YkvA (DUF1232 family)
MKKRITFGRRRRRRNAARSLVRELPNFFKLVFRLLRDPRTPALNKVLFGAVAVYMLTPLDLLPDFFGVLGWVDDLYLLGLALGRLLASAGARLSGGGRRGDGRHAAAERAARAPEYRAQAIASAQPAPARTGEAHTAG